MTGAKERTMNRVCVPSASPAVFFDAEKSGPKAFEDDLSVLQDRKSIARVSGSVSLLCPHVELFPKTGSENRKKVPLA